METNQTNHGIILKDPTPQSYRYGGFSTPAPVRTVINWAYYLPDYEPQSGDGIDYECCVTESAIHAIETQIQYEITNGRFTDEALAYFHSAGYMNTGNFRLSVRYNAGLNGTTINGNDMETVGNHLVTDGLLPYSDMPFTQGMSWAEYYTPATADLQIKAKNIYNYFTIQPPTWVQPGDIASALLNAPIQIATGVCDGWSTSSIIASCGASCAHCTMVYGEDATQNYLIRDTYDPANKVLSATYYIFAAMQYVVTPILPPTMWQKLLAFLKGRNFSSSSI